MIKELCKTISPSGCEEQIRGLIKRYIKDKFDNIRTDNLGNLICGSASAPLCIECGMDSCGVMVVAVEDDKAYITGVGGINAEYLIGKKILFTDGRFCIVRYDGKVASESKMSDLYLVGDTNKLKVGEFGVVKSGYCETDDKMFANGLGNKIGVAAVIEALNKIDDTSDICVIFSAQKRLGAKGAQAFFENNGFEKIITVDALLCEKGIKSGKGCVLIVSDKNFVCSQNFKNSLSECAVKKGKELTVAVTEQNLCMAQMGSVGKGAECAGVAIPTFCKDGNFECVHKKDFEAAVEFLSAVIK